MTDVVRSSDRDGAGASDASIAPAGEAAGAAVEAAAAAAAGELLADPVKLPGVCGDGYCNVNESCKTCSPDCGSCVACSLAPSCSRAAGIPTAATHLSAFDSGARQIYTSGVDEETGAPLGTDFDGTECVAPELRVRVRQINVVRDGVWLGSADLYCIVSASDGAHSEVAITPLQYDVGDAHPPLIFPPEASLFWGQGKSWQTLDNLTITYQCFSAVSYESYTKVFDALQTGAKLAGGIAGPWGWAFGVGSVAAGLVSAGIPKGQDASRINVQQTIDRSMLLELTNGRRWQVRGQGQADLLGGYWDWSLEVESWGCSGARPRVN